jgi:hypothetical protein
MILSWLLLIADYAAFFLGIWRSAVAGNTTTTNPFVIALGCLYGSPAIPGLFVVAAACTSPLVSRGFQRLSTP